MGIGSANRLTSEPFAPCSGSPTARKVWSGSRLLLYPSGSPHVVELPSEENPVVGLAPAASFAGDRVAMRLEPVSVSDPRSMSGDLPDLTLAARRADRGEAQAIGEQGEERLAAVAVVLQGGAEVRKLRARGRLDLLHHSRQLVRRLLHGRDLGFEVPDPCRALAQLRFPLSCGTETM